MRFGFCGHADAENPARLGTGARLEDKAKLASLTRHLMPPTYEIVGKRWAGESGVPPEETPPHAPAFVWFVKVTPSHPSPSHTVHFPAPTLAHPLAID